MAKKIFSQESGEYVILLAEALKKIPEFEVPEWTFFVKSGSSRERPPAQEDFWYLRAASILRQLYIKGVVGVGRLRTRYGSRKDRGGKPDQFRKGSGKIIRVILQQGEKAGLVERLDRLQHGRRLTQVGRDFLDSIEVESKEDFDLDNVLIKSSVVDVEQEVAIENIATEDVEQDDGDGDEVGEKEKNEVKEVEDDGGDDDVEEKEKNEVEGGEDDVEVKKVEGNDGK